jgi:hypothetical protein
MLNEEMDIVNPTQKFLIHSTTIATSENKITKILTNPIHFQNTVTHQLKTSNAKNYK